VNANAGFDKALASASVCISKVSSLRENCARLEQFVEFIKVVASDVDSLSKAIDTLRCLIPGKFLENLENELTKYRQNVEEERREDDEISNQTERLENGQKATEQFKKELEQEKSEKDAILLPFTGIDIVLAGARAEMARMTELHDAEMKAIMQSLLT
jgi:DNA repair exonuclease SbcCD ATPase subunit